MALGGHSPARVMISEICAVVSPLLPVSQTTFKTNFISLLKVVLRATEPLQRLNRTNGHEGIERAT